jgi:hypothetical protein
MQPTAFSNIKHHHVSICGRDKLKKYLFGGEVVSFNGRNRFDSVYRHIDGVGQRSKGKSHLLFYTELGERLRSKALPRGK